MVNKEYCTFRIASEDGGNNVDNDDRGESFVKVQRAIALSSENISLEQNQAAASGDTAEERKARAGNAMRTAKERGLELPVTLQEEKYKGETRHKSRNQNQFIQW